MQARRPPFSSQSMSCRHPVECRNAKTASYLGRPVSLKLICLLDAILRDHYDGDLVWATRSHPAGREGARRMREFCRAEKGPSEKGRSKEGRKEGDKTRKGGQFGSAMTGIGISRSLARLRLCRAFMAECELRPAKALPRPCHPGLNTVQING